MPENLQWRTYVCIHTLYMYLYVLIIENTGGVPVDYPNDIDILYNILFYTIAVILRSVTKEQCIKLLA